MRIGTITFHWATNYGAVLQAYALQKFIKKKGYEIEIINYIPFRVKILQIITAIMKIDLDWFLKEVKINKFRKSHLKTSKRTYFSSRSLHKHCNNYDIYICGSDQVWNESFIWHAESKPVLSYYLDFVNNEKVRVSYATSFGTDTLSNEVASLVKPELAKFSSIGVREKTGKSIVENLGFNAFLVIDPTLLLNIEDYNNLANEKKINIDNQLFTYILHKNQKTAQKIEDYLYSFHFRKQKNSKKFTGVLEWIAGAKRSQFILTNSFHGTILAIIFQKPFIVVPVEDSKMNDRIQTLLSMVGLEDRIIDAFDENKINNLLKESIDWVYVGNRLHSMREKSIEFLENALEI